MQQLNEIVSSTIDSLHIVSDLLYKNNMSSAYQELNNTLPKIMNLMEAYYKVNGIESKELLDVLKIAMNAMEIEDGVLLADVIEYEVKPVIESFI